MKTPLPSYLTAIRDYLKNREPDIWKWFIENRNEKKLVESLRFQLLTSTYRLDRENESEQPLYNVADEIRETLGIESPITLYQLQEQSEANASMLSLPNEMHLIFYGQIRTNLSSLELKALFAHEMAHYLLGTNENNEFQIVDEILTALSHDSYCGDTYLASLRLFNLYTELYCDRVALEMLHDIEPVVSMLVKVRTGLAEVSAKSYLKQADEIFAQVPATGFQSEGFTHPEIFVRTRSLKLWSTCRGDTKKVDAEIARIIQGEPKLDGIDLLDRDRLCGLTRQLIDGFLDSKELQTDLTLSHAKLFFNDYTSPENECEQNIVFSDFPVSDTSLRDYWCFVLLDFAAADHDLEELPIKKSFEIAQKMNIADRFAEIAQKELKLRKRDVQKYLP
ncbi:MAG: M56 family metallopeptidase [Planctomycetaceae bacterium]|jgi:hypothetical protein|nr:M56 family metallopeptidase [Planctomycetaceae bacterium]